ncbi:unnamed protein product [Timema podura]|uniref:Uncharacterized protein n=1 Tax=Timema podura TaxID=61482 RepID=A0ABN7P938_TIMPD|nr:unnamed protein product [Timema podura]
MDINVGQLRKKLVMAQGENQRIQAAITDLENKLQELETGETEKEKFLLEQWQDKTQKEVLIYNQKLVELEEMHSLEAQQLGAHIDDLNTKLALKDNEGGPRKSSPRPVSSRCLTLKGIDLFQFRVRHLLDIGGGLLFRGPHCIYQK